jgi:hypothetical protein
VEGLKGSRSGEGVEKEERREKKETPRFRRFCFFFENRSRTKKSPFIAASAALSLVRFSDEFQCSRDFACVFFALMAE